MSDGRCVSFWAVRMARSSCGKSLTSLTCCTFQCHPRKRVPTSSESERCVAFDGDVVVVVEPHEIRESQVAGDGSGFVRNAFHQVAVAADCIDAIAKDVMAVLV